VLQTGKYEITKAKDYQHPYVYKTLVKSILIHGNESWLQKRKDEDMVRNFHRGTHGPIKENGALRSRN
jgi:hypothetical protein